MHRLNSKFRAREISGIGLKLRFFISIFLVLAFTVAAISGVHFWFFRGERLKLIDREIETSASILISSDLSMDQLEDLEQADDIVHDVFGDDRFNHVVMIYNRQGHVIYRSKNAEYLPERIPAASPWQTLEISDHYIRLLTLPWPNRMLTLQVGRVLDSDLLRWRARSRILLGYTFAISLLIFGMTILLSRLLLAPLQSLSAYLKHLASHFDLGILSVRDISRNEFGESVRNPLTDLWMPPDKLRFLVHNDEFSDLSAAVQTLAQKIQQSFQLTRSGTAQMAHEIKTPLTVIRNSLETAHQNARDNPSDKLTLALTEASSEVDHLSQIVNDFLDWARAENTPSSALDVHAVDLAKIVQEASAKFARLYEGRLKVEVEGAERVFARPSFVDQVVVNLVGNALKYSDADACVKVSLKGLELCVEDEGDGISQAVLEKLGQPFNAQESHGQKGTGLGLAWVATICRKYNWSFVLSQRYPGKGTLARVLFRSPSSELDSVE